MNPILSNDTVKRYHENYMGKNLLEGWNTTKGNYTMNLSKVGDHVSLNAKNFNSSLINIETVRCENN